MKLSAIAEASIYEQNHKNHPKTYYNEFSTTRYASVKMYESIEDMKQAKNILEDEHEQLLDKRKSICEELNSKAMKIESVSNMIDVVEREVQKRNEIFSESLSTLAITDRTNSDIRTAFVESGIEIPAELSTMLESNSEEATEEVEQAANSAAN